VFDVVTRAGGGTTQTFATLRPGLVWEKRRDSSSNHYLFDVNRGNDNYLSSNLTSAEATSAGAFTFNTNSYIVSSGFDWPGGATVVDWVWDAGTSTVSNTQGSITSTVRANPSAGFSVVTYTGTGTTSTVGHGLGVTPALIIVKDRVSGITDWVVYHSSLGASDVLLLNRTDAKVTVSGYWGSLSSTTFGVLGGTYAHNRSGDNNVAYCFAPVVGYNSFGSYTGNGSTDGPFVYTGFRPRWVMIKCSSASGASSNWIIQDTARNTYNAINTILLPNLSNGEITDVDYSIDFLSNGFKPRTTNSNWNLGTATYVWAAFAEAPFNYSRAR
jgi:hypothetical protein